MILLQYENTEKGIKGTPCLISNQKAHSWPYTIVANLATMIFKRNIIIIVLGLTVLALAAEARQAGLAASRVTEGRLDPPNGYPWDDICEEYGSFSLSLQPSAKITDEKTRRSRSSPRLLHRCLRRPPASDRDCITYSSVLLSNIYGHYNQAAITTSPITLLVTV